MSSLEDQRGVKRLMQWRPDGRGRGGKPADLWHTFPTNCCRWKGLQLWELDARNYQRWMKMQPEFLHFVKLLTRFFFHVLTREPVPETRRSHHNINTPYMN